MVCVYVGMDVGVLVGGSLECTCVVMWFDVRMCKGFVTCLVWVV